ncbi:hypothetical protein LF887_04375 [Chryseobacterium sp. MEBOG06]|uniref:hypothetical protein n=1 Tax=Chryseobacterium sp. MEBOG06 TaxID=2879938 RepID=UPI001F466155|nr:hypothetical protein [Chryseobacterium sp. MEBOG06]UKB84876.1 hypothetical protein LF887_04375 [Chryseobacterium sp. MEBOG06]
MKLLLLFLFYPFYFSFCQSNNMAKMDSILNNYKYRYDSIGLKSKIINDQIGKITYCKMFFNKLLLNENYKSKDKIKNTINEFDFTLPSKWDYNKLLNDKEAVLQLMNTVLFSEKYKLKKIYYSEINKYYDEEINKLENRISYLLTLENIDINYYNNLTADEKENLLIELQKKHK